MSFSLVRDATKQYYGTLKIFSLNKYPFEFVLTFSEFRRVFLSLSVGVILVLK